MDNSLSKAKTWSFATVREAYNKDGEKIGHRLVFSKGIKIIAELDGVQREIDLGEYNNVFLNDADERLGYLLEKEFITEEKYKDDLAFNKEKHVLFVASGNLAG